MRTYIPQTQNHNLQEGECFKDMFLKYTEIFRDKIETVNLAYDIEELPAVLCNQKPNLIFLDMTQEDEEIELYWQMMKSYCIPNETILVFNGLSITSIPFFTRNCEQLVAILKPDTIAKAFRYVDNTKNPAKEIVYCFVNRSGYFIKNFIVMMLTFCSFQLSKNSCVIVRNFLSRNLGSESFIQLFDTKNYFTHLTCRGYVRNITPV